MDKFVKAHDHSRIGYYIRPNGCWEWTGAPDKDGYGVIHLSRPKNISVRAHRWIYEQHKEIIPKNKECHHICKNRKCVNPEHIQLVTSKEHYYQDIGKQEGRHKLCLIMANVQRNKTHCPSGHEYTSDNLTGNRRSRVCKICYQAQYQKRFREGYYSKEVRKQRRLKLKMGANWIRFVSTVSNDKQSVLTK